MAQGDPREPIVHARAALCLGTAGSVRLATPAHGRQDAGTHVVMPGASLAHNEALTVREERCVVA